MAPQSSKLNSLCFSVSLYKSVSFDCCFVFKCLSFEKRERYENYNIYVIEENKDELKCIHNMYNVAFNEITNKHKNQNKQRSLLAFICKHIIVLETIDY